MELRQPGRSEAVTGGAMDKVVVRKRIDKRILLGGGVAASCCWSSSSGCLRRARIRCPSARDRLTICNVQSGTFDDFLPLAARVTPLSPSISMRSRAAASTRSWSRTARR